ncbi:MAG: hypothetical protein ACWGNI_02150, partial [Desulfobacterales bacterium]
SGSISDLSDFSQVFLAADILGFLQAILILNNGLFTNKDFALTLKETREKVIIPPRMVGTYKLM